MRACFRRRWRSPWKGWTPARWWHATKAFAACGPLPAGRRRVFVLSRVTLGADVAVTSVILSAAKKRFPNARIVFVGPRKNYELFAADRRIHHAEVAYRRGNLRERLSAWEELKAAVTATDSTVIDPDSRLTQLGLLPVCSEDAITCLKAAAMAAIRTGPCRNWRRIGWRRRSGSKARSPMWRWGPRHRKRRMSR